MTTNGPDNDSDNSPQDADTASSAGMPSSEQGAAVKTEFSEDDIPPQSRLIIDLDGFEGPLDILLALCRDQKVDLVQISILELANQYLEFIAQARELKLEIAADYLVMAAWLAYLKSRLLLPQVQDEDEPSGPEMAAALSFHLQRYKAMKEAGARLMERPCLGIDFFPRGEPGGIRNIRKTIYEATLYDLLKAYGNQKRRTQDSTLHIIADTELYSVDDALERLSRLLGGPSDWMTIFKFLPPNLGEGLPLRSALATTLVATLEMAKQGRLKIRQSENFGKIFLKGIAESNPAASAVTPDHKNSD